MQDNPSANDPRKVWQNQPTEPSSMTLEKIRRKTQELHAKTRRTLLGSIASPIIVIFCYGIVIEQFHGPISSLQFQLIEGMRLLYAVAMAWSLAGMYFLNRGMWSAALPQDAALSTGLESYRREVGRQRSLFRRALLWQFGPIILSVANIIVFMVIAGGMRNFSKGMPFFILVATWIAGYFVLRMKQGRQLQREIHELNEIEKENL